MGIINSPPGLLRDSLREGKIVVAVYGLGHVGLAISVAWLNSGAKVIGVDIDKDIVDSINRRVPPLREEPGVPEAVDRYVASGQLTATLDGAAASKKSNVKIVTVPTLPTPDKKCDFSALRHALQAIAKGLKKGDLVIMESSVPPETTVTLAKPTLEKLTKLKAEEDFGLAFSPERIFEGRVLEDIERRYPKVVGGIGPKSTQAAAALFEVIAKKGVITVSSPTVAEMSKLFEGVYRDVNIALANELGRLCGALDVDFNEVREAANSQPFCHLHLPGFVGGWCIPYYPHFVMQAATKEKMKLPLTKLARTINEDKPALLVKVADSTLRGINKRGLRGSRVAILGLAFRADIGDARNSPSAEVIELLKAKGVSEMKAHDPYITKNISFHKKGVQLQASVSEATKNAELIIVMTDHSIFKENLSIDELLETAAAGAVVIDGRNILSVKRRKIGSENFVQKQVEGFRMFLRKK